MPFHAASGSGSDRDFDPTFASFDEEPPDVDVFDDSPPQGYDDAPGEDYAAIDGNGYGFLDESEQYEDASELYQSILEGQISSMQRQIEDRDKAAREATYSAQLEADANDYADPDAYETANPADASYTSDDGGSAARAAAGPTTPMLSTPNGPMVMPAPGIPVPGLPPIPLPSALTLLALQRADQEWGGPAGGRVPRPPVPVTPVTAPASQVMQRFVPRADPRGEPCTPLAFLTRPECRGVTPGGYPAPPPAPPPSGAAPRSNAPCSPLSYLSRPECRGVAPGGYPPGTSLTAPLPTMVMQRYIPGQPRIPVAPLAPIPRPPRAPSDPGWDLNTRRTPVSTAVRAVIRPSGRAMSEWSAGAGPGALFDRNPLTAARAVVAAARAGCGQAVGYVYRTVGLAQAGSAMHVPAAILLTQASRIANLDEITERYLRMAVQMHGPSYVAGYLGREPQPMGRPDTVNAWNRSALYRWGQLE